jgi:hypothetical protein
VIAHGTRSSLAIGFLATALVVTSCTAPKQRATYGTPGSSSPPSTSSSPSAASPGPVPGVTGPVCHISSLKADFGLGGASRAFVFSKPSGGSCEKKQAFVVVSGADNPSAPFGPITCEVACRVLAAPDMNSDGRAELEVSTVRGIFTYFDLFRVLSGTPPTLEPFGIRRRSGNEQPLIGKYAIALGGTTQSMAGVWCGPKPGYLELWSAAETIEGAGPYDLGIDVYRIRGSSLIPVRHTNYLVPQGRHDLLPQGGGLAFGQRNGLCGLRR